MYDLQFNNEEIPEYWVNALQTILLLPTLRKRFVVPLAKWNPGQSSNQFVWFDLQVLSMSETTRRPREVMILKFWLRSALVRRTRRFLACATFLIFE